MLDLLLGQVKMHIFCQEGGQGTKRIATKQPCLKAVTDRGILRCPESWQILLTVRGEIPSSKTNPKLNSFENKGNVEPNGHTPTYPCKIKELGY